MKSETGVGRRRARGVDADEEVVGARGGDRVQRVPGHQWWVVRSFNFGGDDFRPGEQWWVVRVLNFDRAVFYLWKQISLVLGIPREVGGAIVGHGSSVH